MQSLNSGPQVKRGVAIECVSGGGIGDLGDDLIFSDPQAMCGDVFDLGWGNGVLRQWRSW
jgi:hypothetical protein